MSRIHTWAEDLPTEAVVNDENWEPKVRYPSSKFLFLNLSFTFGEFSFSNKELVYLDWSNM
jgi:hypothetical protein